MLYSPWWVFVVAVLSFASTYVYYTIVDYRRNKALYRRLFPEEHARVDQSVEELRAAMRKPARGARRNDGASDSAGASASSWSGDSSHGSSYGDCGSHGDGGGSCDGGGGGH